MVEFFRHCPGCGQRFHVKLENKKIIRDEKRIIPSKRLPLPRGSEGATYSDAVMLEGEPIILEAKEFEYKYKCGHCSHEWTEKRVEG